MSRQFTEIHNVQIMGNGSKIILFAHGFGCDQKMWRYITPAFEDEYKLVLFDYIGSGKSDVSFYNTEKYASLNGYAADIINICKELKLKDVIFVGHSVSCMIGLLAAISNPEYFSIVIMVSPSPGYINDGNYKGGFDKKEIENLLAVMDRNYINWAQLYAPNIMGNPDRPELGEELTESFCSTDPIIARQFAEVTFFSDNRADLANLKIPSLIMQCSDDILAPIEVGYYLKKHIPDNTLRIMKATGHCPHLSAPGETISVIKDYLMKCD